MQGTNVIGQYFRKLVDQAFAARRPELLAQMHEQLRSQFANELNAIRLRVEQFIADLNASNESRIRGALSSQMFVPNLSIAPQTDRGREFMAHSTCSAADFFHPRFREICEMAHYPTLLHRKYWEWAFIIHKLSLAGVLTAGKRGIVFGVGQERLPALFAKLGASIVATDAPKHIGVAAGWSSSGEYSDSLERLRYPIIVENAVFDKNVVYRSCDMTQIDGDLTDFDFAWSSCCFEHLGSLEAGMRFVVDSVEKTLKSGGVACHTTEFNLSSDDETLVDGPTVVYRRQDILRLVERLRERGHEVEPILIAPDSHFLDFYVDVPPYVPNPHLKLRLGSFVSTSIGIFIRRH